MTGAAAAAPTGHGRRPAALLYPHAPDRTGKIDATVNPCADNRKPCAAGADRIWHTALPIV